MQENGNAAGNATVEMNALSSWTDAVDVSSEVVKLIDVPSMNMLPHPAGCDDNIETEFQRHAEENDEDVSNALSEESSAVQEEIWGCRRIKYGFA